MGGDACWSLCVSQIYWLAIIGLQLTTTHLHSNFETPILYLTWTTGKVSVKSWMICNKMVALQWQEETYDPHGLGFFK